MRVVMHIRAADADGMDGDLDFAGTKVQRNVDLAHRELMPTFKDEGLHQNFLVDAMIPN